jgi:hypothetical protein
MPLTRIKSLGITDGTIVNADINASAAIAGTKISGSFGKVLQVVSTNKTDTTSTSSGSFSDITGMSVSITPSSASSKIFIIFTINLGIQEGRYGSHIKLLRNSTDINIGDTAGSRISSTVSKISPNDSGSPDYMFTLTHNFLDSPSTTSATTYKLQWLTLYSTASYLNRSFDDTDSGDRARTASTITVMEIAG